MPNDKQPDMGSIELECQRCQWLEGLLMAFLSVLDAQKREVEAAKILDGKHGKNHQALWGREMEIRAIIKEVGTIVDADFMEAVIADSETWH